MDTSRSHGDPPPSSRWADSLGFDIQTVRYDPARYPFERWLLAELGSAGYRLDALDAWHQHVPLDATAPLTRTLIRATEGAAFRRMYFAFVREVLQPLAGRTIAPQRYPNVRAHLPDRPEMCIPFHTDGWYGHGPDEINVWLPLTRAADTASLALVPLARSLELTDQARARRMRLAEMEALFRPAARALDVALGDAVLFTPAHLHGNTTNLSGRTRVSLDFRVAVEGGRINKKRVGGYFVLMPEETG